MRKVSCLLLYLCLFIGSYAQSKTPIFIFDHFLQATIHFKNNTRTVALMNYDVVNGRMLFEQGEQMMELTNIASILNIEWKDKRKFIVQGNDFLEEIRLKNGIVYIKWRIKNQIVGSKGAMGLTTQTKVETISLQSMGIYSMDDKPQSADVYQQINNNEYFLYINGTLQKVKTLAQIVKLYPGHKEQIRQFARDNRINMSKTLSVLELLNYCLSLGE